MVQPYTSGHLHHCTSAKYCTSAKGPKQFVLTLSGHSILLTALWYFYVKFARYKAGELMKG